MEFRNLRAHIEKYVHLTDTEFASACAFFSARQVTRGEVLIAPTQMVHHSYWVDNGLIVSTFVDEHGKEHIIQFAIEGCWITDQNAYYNRAEAAFKVTCLEEGQVLALRYDKREELCERIPKMERFFRKKANESFVKQQNRLLTYLTSDAQQRFDLLLQEYPGLYERVTKKVLASYLGVSRETLSRFHP